MVFTHKNRFCAVSTRMTFQGESREIFDDVGGGKGGLKSGWALVEVEVRGKGQVEGGG